MIENYGIFNYHESNNELVILFGESSDSRKKINDEVSLLLKDDKAVGYSITNFIKYAKIKYSGIIFLPADILIDVINSVLLNANQEPLAYKNGSGYIIKKIDQKVVVYAENGVYLKGEKISLGHICTYDDLYIKNDHPEDVLFLEDDNNVGKDFFLAEVK